MSALDNGDKHPRYWAAKGKRKIEGLAREETGTSAEAAEFTARGGELRDHVPRLLPSRERRRSASADHPGKFKRALAPSKRGNDADVAISIIKGFPELSRGCATDLF